LMRVRSEFIVFERHSEKHDIPAQNVDRILKIVNSGWFCFIPAICDWGCTVMPVLKLLNSLFL